MYILKNGKAILWLGIMICVFNSQAGYAKKRTVKHDARITNRPDDVPVVKCGGDISLTCVSEGKPAPKIEWWYHNEDLDEKRRKAILKQAAREGRIKIKTEEMYLVRSTLIIRNADESDEGMYQCRASNSPVREDRNINIYQHWRIEEVPVNKVMCKDKVLTHTELYSASKYNTSIFNESAERALSSIGLTSSDLTTTTTMQTESPQLKTSYLTSPAITKATTTKTAERRRMKTFGLTSSTTIRTAYPTKPHKPVDQSRNNVRRGKKELKKKISRNVIEKESKRNENIIGLHNKKSEAKPARVNGATLEQGENGDRNSASGIHQRSWMMALLQLSFVTFVILTSW